MKVTGLKVHMRNDLAKQGLSIPCTYQDGAYLTASDIEASEILGTIKDGSQYVLLLPYQDGIRSITIVESIDLDFTVEPIV